ncbi:DUF1349 domain-containing protein [Tessaracoccus sp. ZS01]|uniref:DUF1349 domain-containing protein n=1 Tax=Tessaracoccus sp. ZS01 TaxID=1906324 RepID=UPI0011815483|nr:DUF1349 domain-containing protein [Tessaracoccus sp. ZS01]MCG6566885.1 DUF1349 domain-containing protein [Tessaracoccus sp. ZS01]
MQRLNWNDGTWTTPPVEAREEGTDLFVTAAEKSDAWRITSYGFERYNAHALVAPLAQDSAMEVVFTANFDEQFDQAGIFLTAGPDAWVKAGVEFADGHPMVGAVVTNPLSDWSTSPVDEWQGRRVRVRLSRSGDAVTVRAGLDGGELRLVRLAAFPADAEGQAGPFTCAPERAGLSVRFHEWSLGPADLSLH